MLRRFTARDLKFFFSSSNSKGYLLQPATHELTHFTINNESVQNEKTIRLFQKPIKIISYGISIRAERLFYLTEEKNVLYSHGITDHRELEICHLTIKDSCVFKSLRLNNEMPYDYVKCFNEDLCVVLGNSQ